MKYRNLILKIFSLGVGIAISFVLIAKVSFESSYDSFYKDIDRIYQIGCKAIHNGKHAEYGHISGAVAPGFVQYVPGVETATRMTGLFESNRFVLEDKSVVSGYSNLADTAFFKVFQREILAGDAYTVFNTPGQTMVSRSFAEKLGGIDQAMNKQIVNEDMPQIKWTIGGVFEDFPDNGTFSYDVLLSLASYAKWSTENWVGNDRYTGYVKLEPGVDPSSLSDAIRLMQEKNQPQLIEAEKDGNSLTYYLKPFNKAHTSMDYVHNQMLILSIISFILLVISLMNYSLISVSEMVKRSKDMGVHKCYGAEGWDVYKMLMKETAITLVWSSIIAVILTIGAQSLIEELLGVTLLSLIIPQTCVILSILLVFLFLISVWVPGYLYNHVPVSIVFHHYQANKRHWKLALLTVQFAINVFMVGFLLIISGQYNKVLSLDVGYDYEHVYGYNTAGVELSSTLRAIESLQSLPEVIDVERCYTLPFAPCSGNNVYLPEMQKELFNIADQYLGTEGIFDFFDFKLIEGRVPQTLKEVAVSRRFLTEINKFTDWSDGAIGKQVGITEHCNDFSDYLTITGVYEDYLIGSGNYPDERPSVRFTAEMNSDEWMPFTVLKLKNDNPEVLEKIRKTVQSCIEEKTIEILSYRDEMVNIYDNNRKMRNTILVGCIFAIVIAFLGLVGYIMDEALRRSKEIAIRKINGATTNEIISLFVKDILKLALIAVVIGDAAAYYVSGLWLEQFAEKVSLSIGYFLAADVVVVGLIISVVVLYSMKIAHANPVESLKSE